MTQRQAWRKGGMLTLALVLGGVVSLVDIHSREARSPYSKDAIVGLLKGQVSPQRVAVLAKQHGIDFQVTSRVENELRRAGATDALLETLRTLAPKPTVPAIQQPPAASPPAEVRAGTVKMSLGDGLNYVRVPPGSFVMGCSPGDTECYGDEKPLHQVIISKGFWVGQTPVTVAAYRRYAGAAGKAMPPAPDFNPGWNNPEMPIVNVSWQDAVAYCTWAGGRLPTEAEWEYAARATSTQGRYGPLDEVAWYVGNSGRRAHEVGQKRANAWDLQDMLGNVWEWVNDWYGWYPVSPEHDPRGPENGQYRVLRGGAWNFKARNVRVSDRNKVRPDGSSDNLGFRCVREADNPRSSSLFP